MIQNPSITRTMIVLAATFLFCVVATTVFCAYIAYRTVTATTRSGVLLHPRVVQTPFGPVKGIGPAEFSATTKLPIYPGAAARESGLVGYSNHRLKSGRVSDVMFLRLQTDVDLSIVDKWYQDRLTGFVRTAGPANTIARQDDSRVPELATNPTASAVLFLQGDAAVRDEVLIERASQGDGLAITLTHHMR